MRPLLEIKDLCVDYRFRSGRELQALDGVSFSLAPGEVLGILGESGSGKSSLAAAVLRLLPPNGRIARGSVLFEGTDLLAVSNEVLRTFRGARISLIFQEPSLALHPMMRAGEQVGEVARAHLGRDATSVREKTDAALRSVFGSDASVVATAYPHELSGGQRQRVLIAQAIVCGPSVLIADEPTASLDPVTQAEILELFRELQRTLGLALILITHNPALLAGFADHILVLYAGVHIESGPAKAVLSQPLHPYTQGLLDCLPDWPPWSALEARLRVIAGDSPDMSSLPGGCRFEARCPLRMEACTVREPVPISVESSHSVSCFKFGG